MGRSYWGNNLYLDNVSLNDQPLGLTTEQTSAAVVFWPNPVSGGAPLHLQLPTTSPNQLRLLDALGRVVWASTATHEQELLLTAPQRAGLYTLQVLSETGHRHCQRLVVY